jgi:hypothetical protein
MADVPAVICPWNWGRPSLCAAVRTNGVSCVTLLTVTVGVETMRIPTAVEVDASQEAGPQQGT